MGLYVTTSIVLVNAIAIHHRLLHYCLHNKKSTFTLTKSVTKRVGTHGLMVDPA